MTTTMTIDAPTPAQILARQLGRPLTAVARLVFRQPDGALDESSGDVQLSFGDDVLVLGSAADGEALALSVGPWRDPFAEPLDADNRAFVARHGRWLMVDQRDREPWSALIGQPLRALQGLEGPRGVRVGVRLGFDSGEVDVLVDGDETAVAFRAGD